MSSTLPNLNSISNEAKQLISHLNLPEISDNNSEFDANTVFGKETISDEADDNANSPFISSEMYNYLVNKHNTDSVNVNMLGGGKIEEDSQTSTTSSSLSSSDLKSSSSETDVKPVKKDKKDKKNKKHVDEEDNLKTEKINEESVQTESDNYEGWGAKKNIKSKPKVTKTKKSKYTDII
jgi:hypothetical protein